MPTGLGSDTYRHWHWHFLACQQRIDFLLYGIELIQSQPRIRDNKGLAGFDVFVN